MNEEPPFIDLRVDLARPTDPTLFCPGFLVAPQSINVDDCKGTILLFRDLDADRLPPVVHEFVRREQ